MDGGTYEYVRIAARGTLKQIKGQISGGQDVHGRRVTKVSAVKSTEWKREQSYVVT